MLLSFIIYINSSPALSGIDAVESIRFWKATSWRLQVWNNSWFRIRPAQIQSMDAWSCCQKETCTPHISRCGTCKDFIHTHDNPGSEFKSLRRRYSMLHLHVQWWKIGQEEIVKLNEFTGYNSDRSIVLEKGNIAVFLLVDSTKDYPHIQNISESIRDGSYNIARVGAVFSRNRNGAFGVN